MGAPLSRGCQSRDSSFLAVWVVLGWGPYSPAWLPFPFRVGVCLGWDTVRGLWEACFVRVPVGVCTCVHVTDSVSLGKNKVCREKAGPTSATQVLGVSGSGLAFLSFPFILFIYLMGAGA